MARTAKEIEEKIEFLTLRRNRTRSTEGWMSLNERIGYLKGELMLQREKERYEAEHGSREENRKGLDEWRKAQGIPTADEMFK